MFDSAIELLSDEGIALSRTRQQTSVVLLLPQRVRRYVCFSPTVFSVGDGGGRLLTRCYCHRSAVCLSNGKEERSRFLHHFLLQSKFARKKFCPSHISDTKEMARRKVLFFDSKTYDEKTFNQALQALNGQEKLHFTFLESKLTSETVSEGRGFDAICVFVNDVLSQDVLEELHKTCDSVKIIALRSAGFNNVHLETAEKYDIRVCRVPRYSPHAVAEHSVALLLSLNRNMHHAFFRTKQHNFSLDGLVGIDLFGKTVGIIGTGGIGICAINIFLGFGCKVVCYDTFPNEKAAKEKGFTYTTMDELLRQSDIGRQTARFIRTRNLTVCSSVNLRSTGRFNLSHDQQRCAGQDETGCHARQYKSRWTCRCKGSRRLSQIWKTAWRRARCLRIREGLFLQ